MRPSDHKPIAESIPAAAADGIYVISSLGELQLKGRAAPALVSLDRQGRVLHIICFTKTISPSLRLGFVIVPQFRSSRSLPPVW